MLEMFSRDYYWLLDISYIMIHRLVTTCFYCNESYLFNLSCSCKQQLKQKDVYLSYLPLAHIFDRVIEELFIFNGASIGFWRGVSALKYFVSL